MTKLERVTGIALLTALVCTVHAQIIPYIYDRVSSVVLEIAKSMATA